MQLVKSTLLFAFFMAFSLQLNAQIKFKDFTTYSIGSRFKKVIVADFNNDKRDDIAATTEDAGIASSADYTLNLFYQDANGYLSSPSRIKYDLRSYSTGLASGDINNDGLQDIVIAVWDTIKLFTQKPNGTMSFDRQWKGGDFADNLKIGDMNNDGLADIVVSHSPDDNITVYYQQKNKTFKASQYIIPSGGRNKLALGDVNGDGKTDIMLHVGQINLGLVALIQRDTGLDRNYLGFRIPSPRFNFEDIEIGDLNHDGYEDLVACIGFNSPNAKLYIWYQNPLTRTLNAPIISLTYDIPEQLVIDDFDNDCKNDIGIAHGGWVNYSIWSHDCSRNFKEVWRKYIPYSSFYQAMATGIIGLDGKKDIIVGTTDPQFLFLENESIPKRVKMVSQQVFTVNIGETVILADSTLVIKSDTANRRIIKTTTKTVFKTEKRTTTQRMDSTIINFDSLCLQRDTIVKRKFTLLNVTALTDTTVSITRDTFLISAQNEWKEAPLTVTIFPNPTRDLLFFKWSEPITTPFLVTIHALDGRLMYKNTINPNWERSIPVSNLTAGVYALMMNVNGVLFRHKLVIVE
jgi:hypothetical protein